MAEKDKIMNGKELTKKQKQTLKKEKKAHDRSAKKQLPEMINSSDMVNILTDDDEFFNKVDLLRPTNYYMSVEKSMYQTISDEMVKMFSTIKDFNSLSVSTTSCKSGFSPKFILLLQTIII